MNLCGLAATVTSCIGGKEEKFAVQVCPAAPARVYFVYKTIGEFHALWGALETLARPVQQRQASLNKDNKLLDTKQPSVLAKWLARVVERYAFREILKDLRAQEKDTRSTLNVLLQFLVARVSGLFLDRHMSQSRSCPIGQELVHLVRTFLLQPVPAGQSKCETCVASELSSMEKTGRKKRSFDEMRPEDGEEQRRSLFPTRNGHEKKTPKVCGMSEWIMPNGGKKGLVAPWLQAASAKCNVKYRTSCHYCGQGVVEWKCMAVVIGTATKVA
uniref:Uncharacterized protein n=1 Tax=Hyaloperonospora arabidopsidis (strain Emoy2) TaxID=559515 RepID=M4B868_HYAAE